MFSSTAVILYIVVVWTAVCLTGYSDYLTGFHEPLSASYICHTGLKTIVSLVEFWFVCRVLVCL